MKTQFTLWQKVANTPPIALLVLFVWLLVPSNAWGDPIAIGSGTVTLDYTNTSNPTAPATNTCVIENETCIAFGNTSTWASWVYSSGVSWNVTIVPGVYDIEATYGTGSWGTKPLFDLYEGEKKVTEIFHAPGGETSGKFNTKAGFSGSNTVDLSTLDGNTTYTLKVTDGWPGAFGTCIGHISFTPKVGVVMAAFGQSAQYGPSTLPENGSNTINDITVTSNMSFDYTGGTYDYLFSNESTDYVDISVGDDQVMTSLATSVLYDGSCTGGLYIKFSSSATFDEDALVGTQILLSGLVFDNFYTYPPSTSSVSLPSGIIKSARIYRNGSCQHGTRLYRIKVEAEADECTKKTASFVKEGTEIGSAPGEIEVCEDASITIPGKGSLSKTGNVFAGWNDGSNTYQEGDSYEMNGSNHTFTAVWNPFTVPAITNLSYTAENEVVTLTYSIPGICDLSNPKTPLHNMDRANTTSKEYEPEGDDVKVTGTMEQYKQFGVAFDIPATTGIEWVSYDFKGTLGSGDHVWGGVDDGSYTYWHFVDPMPDSKIVTSSWQNSGQEYVNRGYWDATDILNTPLSQSCTQVAIYGNTAIWEGSSGTFYVRNVRYHVSTWDVDVDHVVIMRKPGKDQVSSGLSDGTLLEPETRSKFVDDADKAAGWYTYTIFAVHADGTLSTDVSTNVNVVISDPHTVTYALGGGTGTLPTEPSHVEGASFTVANGDGLSYAGHTFAGWNDGTSDYAPGDSYTMPDENVVLTAQWDPIDMPEITNLQIDASSLSSTTLSWKIPGIIDLTTASTSNITEANYAYDFRNPVGSWTLDGEVLDVTYTCGQWAMCGIAFPISLNALESLSVECKANDNYNLEDPGSIILGAHAGSGNVYYGAGKTLTSLVSDFVLHSQVFTKKWYNNAYSGVVNNVDEVCVFINPNPEQTGSHFYIQNLRYHTTGMIDIDHVVVMRKEDSPSTGLSDGTQIYSGTASHWVDEFVKDPHKNYYYTVFAVHADGVAISDPVSVVYNPPAITPHTRSGLRIGDYGTICLPYAVAAADRTGAELFEIESWAENGTSMTMTQLNENENMIAGRPYIFQATANTATFSYYVDGDETPVGTHNGLIGSYVEAQIPENDNNYIIYNNKLYLVNAPARVGAYRAYIHRGGEYSPAPANRRRVTMGLYGTQTTTDINQISTEQITNKVIRNGHLFILRGDKIYNAQGQLVQ